MKKLFAILLLVILSTSFNAFSQVKEKHHIDKWLEDFLKLEENQNTMSMNEGFMTATEK